MEHLCDSVVYLAEFYTVRSGRNAMADPSVETLFHNKAPELKTVYDRLISALHDFGPINIAPKQTSIHLEKHSAFAGVQPRKNHINLEFRIDYKIEDPRITRLLQLSAR